jgi:hypothetical protein
MLTGINRPVIDVLGPGLVISDDFDFLHFDLVFMIIVEFKFHLLAVSGMNDADKHQ